MNQTTYLSIFTSASSWALRRKRPAIATAANKMIGKSACIAGSGVSVVPI